MSWFPNSFGFKGLLYLSEEGAMGVRLQSNLILFKMGYLMTFWCKGFIEIFNVFLRGGVLRSVCKLCPWVLVDGF